MTRGYPVTYYTSSTRGMSPRQGTGACADGADRAVARPFFPICNVNVPGKNVFRLRGPE